MKYRKISRGTSRKLAGFLNKGQLKRLGVKYETTNGSPIINNRIVDIYSDAISIKFEDASCCVIRSNVPNLNHLLQSNTKEQFLCRLLAMEAFRELYYKFSNEVIQVLLKSNIEVTKTLISFELKSGFIIIFDVNKYDILVFNKAIYTIIKRFIINDEKIINDFNNYMINEISKRKIKQ